jgi:cytochrome b561
MNSSESDQLPQMPLGELTRASRIMRFTVIGVVIAGIAGLFAYAGAAGRNRHLGRSAAEHTIGGLFAVVHSPRRRAQRSQRGLYRRNRKMSTPQPRTQFALQSRILHWLMAAMVLAMLFIGVTMVASLGDYHMLVAIHRPLGIMILILTAIRFVNRICTKLPPFPPTMSRQERFLASSSEKLLYALMFAQPLVGWGMLSAGHYPIEMFGSMHLPPILPANPTLYSVLRKAHTILAYLLFLTFLAHLSAVLFHTLIIRDRLLDRMALWPIRSRKNKSQS